ncbi:MAG: hypothetical protein NTX45_30160 [Proteobacteria bacterium]|nr:hypothetical protein [Pseudomonadota bacterium]
MTTNSTTDNKLVSLEDLKIEEGKLLQRVKDVAELLSQNINQNNASVLDGDADELPIITPELVKLKNNLLDDIEGFLDTLEKVSRYPATVEIYLWVCDSAVNWENRLSSLFNVSKIVKLAPAPEDLLPPLARGDALSEKELVSRVDNLAKVVRAYRIGKDRKENREVNEKDITDWDTHQAEVFLAIDILDGTINFPRRISSDSYHRLEKVWMAEVQDLLAYLNWKANGARSFDPQTVNHYTKAWEEFTKRLKAPENKAVSAEFGEAKRYLEKKYVTLTDQGYKIDRDKMNQKGELDIIKIKSNRIAQQTLAWDRDRDWDHDRNWRDAEIYVRKYYENIIPAVMDADPKSTEEVIKAFDYSMKGGAGAEYKHSYRIINSFEMAIAIYFLSVPVLDKLSLPGG